jgi:hypothetical protein
MEDFNHLEKDEKLKAENDFMKMKLMLEQGASFGTGEGRELPAEGENEFLRNVMEFEKQFEENKTIKVFDKIGRPSHFKPVAEIPDEEMEKAWEDLSDHLGEHGLSLDVCSPNISKRELYRFATEELFMHEMGDMNIPGMMHGFIYDEFYPDLVYDNSRLVEQDLFPDIFRKEDLFHEINYDKEDIVFNGKLYETRESFIEMINRFKSLFDKIRLVKCTVTSCEVKEKDCLVAGNYKATAKTGKDKMNYIGGFKVELILNDMDYWYFKNIQMEGFSPG